MGLEPLLAIVLGGDSCDELKPHPEPIFHAMRATRTGPDDSWMIGDNYTDMAAGRRAGLNTCFCRYGFGRLEQEPYTLAVDDIAELPARIADTQRSPVTSGQR